MLVYGLVLGFWVEVGFARFPGFGDFDEDGGYEALEGFFVWEEADDAGSAFDL